jgi:hypothetical protein
LGQHVQIILNSAERRKNSSRVDHGRPAEMCYMPFSRRTPAGQQKGLLAPVILALGMSLCPTVTVRRRQSSLSDQSKLPAEPRVLFALRLRPACFLIALRVHAAGICRADAVDTDSKASPIGGGTGQDGAAHAAPDSRVRTILCQHSSAGRLDAAP